MTTFLSFLLATTMMSCQTGTITLHNNFESVFYYFPERLSDNVHGYVATENCDDIGRYGFIIVGNQVRKVKVADCLNYQDKKKAPERYKGWVADLDEFTYYSLHTKEYKNYGTICLFKKEKISKTKDYEQRKAKAVLR